MKKLKLCLVWLLAVCLFAGAACAEGDGGAITMIHPFEVAGDEGDLADGPAACFEAMIDRWRAAHPEIALDVKTRTMGEISALALMDRLPDVFVLTGGLGRRFVHYGYVADLTQAVFAGPDAQHYDTAALAPYVYYGRVAAFPALAAGRALVLYDARAWAGAGLDGFPRTVDEALAQVEAFRNQGFKGMIALGDGTGKLAIRAVTGPLLYRDGGMEAFMAMVDEDQTRTLRDAAIVEALTGTEALFTGGILAADRPDIDAAAALKRFAKGDCPALLVSGDGVYQALDALREDAPELYAALDFAALPLALSDDGENLAPSGVAYGLFINAQTAKDPERFGACVDLCRALTGPEYADLLAERYGMPSFTAADDGAWRAFYESCGDETLLRLARFINDGAKPCLDITQFLDDSVWSGCGESLLRRLEAALRPGRGGYVPSWEEAANAMQDNYERYCLVRPTAAEAMGEDSGQDG